MSQENLTRLSEAQVRELATAQSFNRGEDYYNDGAIENPTRQGLRLSANCYGSQIYRVSATLDQDGVEDCHCSCPYDWGGICKHLVALLLTYIREPQTFHVIPSIEEMLANHTREDLIDLIGRLTRRYPDLLSLVELSASRTSNQPIDLSVYRRQAQRALSREDSEEIVQDLQVLNETASQFLESGDYLNGGRLYQLLLEEMNLSYDDELQALDYDGDVCVLSQELVSGLGECLALGESELDETTRIPWLFTLLEGYLKELELGGIDYAADASDYLLNCATDAEWSEVEERIRREMSYGSSWRKEALVGFLAARREQKGESEAVRNLIHELGTPQQRAFLLLEEGKIEEAVEIARQHFPNYRGTTLKFADALLKANEQ